MWLRVQKSASRSGHSAGVEYLSRLNTLAGFLVKGFLVRIATRLSGELPNTSPEGAGWKGEGRGWRDEVNLKPSQDGHEARVRQ